jgi:hypothetical protein
MGQFQLATTIDGNIAWHAGNMGSGSGLDADLVRGLVGITVAGGTITGNLTFSPSGTNFGLQLASLTSTQVSAATSMGAGALVWNSTSGALNVYNGSSWGAISGGGSGTVTSVALSAPTQFSVSGSPVTTSGTLALSWASQSVGLFFMSPATGTSSGVPTFRSPVPADLAASPTNGYFLSPSGSGLAWNAPNWVTSITAGSGLSGGTITSAGTISLNLANANTWTATQSFGQISASYATTDASNASGSNSIINLINSSSTGQTTAFSTFINGVMSGKIRTDYAGNISLHSGTSGPGYVSIQPLGTPGTIDFWVGSNSSSGLGTQVMTLTGSGQLQIGQVSSSNVNIGTAQLYINPSSGFTAALQTPFSTSSPCAVFGGFILQGYGTNNGWLADNTYYNGSAFTYVQTGYASMNYFLNGSWEVRVFPSGSAGAAAQSGPANTAQLRVNNDTSVCALGYGTTYPTPTTNFGVYMQNAYASTVDGNGAITTMAPVISLVPSSGKYAYFALGTRGYLGAAGVATDFFTDSTASDVILRADTGYLRLGKQPSTSAVASDMYFPGSLVVTNVPMKFAGGTQSSDGSAGVTGTGGGGDAFKDGLLTTASVSGAIMIVVLASSFTPSATGGDTGPFIVPHAKDGTTSVTYNVKRVYFRVETPSSGSSTIQIEKYTGTGAYSGTSMLSGGMTLSGSSTYEAYALQSSTTPTITTTTVASGDKVRFNFTALDATHANFTIEVLLEKVA